MNRTKNMPLWVYLAFSSITTRKAALLLIQSCVAFSVYCVPWSRLFPGRDWIDRLFLAGDWSWLAMMVPITFWYWLSLRWLDRNSGWRVEEQRQD